MAAKVVSARDPETGYEVKGSKTEVIFFSDSDAALVVEVIRADGSSWYLGEDTRKKGADGQREAVRAGLEAIIKAGGAGI